MFGPIETEIKLKVASPEAAHEALARAWPRLQVWLDEDAAGQLVLRHLNTAARGWNSLGRPVSDLLPLRVVVAHSSARSLAIRSLPRDSQ